MNRQRHDQFAKQYLAELLEPLGHVEKTFEVSGVPHFVDLCFTPSSAASGAAVETLGLLARLVSNACLLEPFRNQPNKGQVRDCILKLFSLHGELQRKAKREDNQYLTDEELPFLWILTPTASEAIVEGFGATEAQDWCPGIYFLAKNLKTAIVAIHQLPKTKETLWLRILGKGRTQQQAIDELLDFPDDNMIRQFVQELLAIWRITLKIQDNLTEDEQELVMNLSPAYQQWREKTLLQGVQQGVQQGLQEGLQQGAQQGAQQGRLDERRDLVENLLQNRFGQLDKPLLQVVGSLVKLPPSELSHVVLQFSREELLSKFL
ncbi:hypothetical protein THIOM_005398 [Candidatus Thiomargarita nelsonii]|uniref:Flagellar assembly protein H n=1 Tax=Candidatus Thiomargarita nelsonii TaxID=1003181 RepID=A0A176RTB7_9GAMM|nr:hypothetical protein THIOM_005398 [Candidatus Thiomargarita nelsonii]